MNLLKNELSTLRQAYDLTENVFIVLDQQFHIQYVNSYMQKIFAVTANGSFINKSFVEFLKALDLPIFLNIKKKTVSLKKIQIHENFFQWKLEPGTVDNKAIYFLFGKDVTQEEKVYQTIEKECQQILGHLFPKRLSVHAYLNEIKYYLTNIINNIPCYVYWKNRELIYLGCNHLTADFLNLKSPAEIVGKTDFDLVPDEALAEGYRTVDREILATGKGILNQPGELVNIKKELFYTLVSKIPIINKDGSIIGLIGITMDVTELKKTQEKYLQSKEEAEAANYIMTELIANLGHDLATPISDVGSVAQMLLLQADEYPELKELFELLAKRCDDCVKVRQKFIDATSVSKLEVKVERFSISVELLKLEKELKSMIGSKNLKLTIRPLIPFKEDFIESDREKFSTLLRELISNAIQFTNEGEISITILKSNGYFHIAVNDTGIGIPSDQFEYIFKQYTKLSRSNKYGATFKGVGAGLYLVTILVKLLNSTISVKSEMGKGSTFTFSVPERFLNT